MCKLMCEDCWVQDVCAWYGMAFEEKTTSLRFGIYGGMTVNEREAFMAKYELKPEHAMEEYERARASLWELAQRSSTVVDWPTRRTQEA
jgi:hypothetical protein